MSGGVYFCSTNHHNPCKTRPTLRSTPPPSGTPYPEKKESTKYLPPSHSPQYATADDDKYIVSPEIRSNSSSASRGFALVDVARAITFVHLSTHRTVTPERRHGPIAVLPVSSAFPGIHTYRYSGSERAWRGISCKAPHLKRGFKVTSSFG